MDSAGVCGDIGLQGEIVRHLPVVRGELIPFAVGVQSAVHDGHGIALPDVLGEAVRRDAHGLAGDGQGRRQTDQQRGCGEKR